LTAFTELGISGYQAADWLREHERVDVGLSDRGRILVTLSMADDRSTEQRLRAALEGLVVAAPKLPRPHPVKLPAPRGLELESVARPRDAFFGPTEAVSVDAAIGRTAAEQITPYPPGIPAIVSGERINREVIDYLLSGLQAGMVLPDPADPTLETVRGSGRSAQALLAAPSAVVTRVNTSAGPSDATHPAGIRSRASDGSQNARMSELSSFAELAAQPDATIDMLALALGAEFREVDAPGAIATLDALGAELSRIAGQTSGAPDELALACAQLLGAAHGFEGDRERYDDPDNSMLDIVLGRRRGLPILLSVVYIEVARRAGIALAGVGLPGHFVVGHFGADPPLLLDPFAGGRRVEAGVARDLLRPWRAHEIAMRMLNNLVLAYQRRGDLGAAIRAASLRLMLGADDPLRKTLLVELRALQSRLN
jgi:regulator of sirC expression with transglutaminase-like and TPR domain